VGGGGGGGQGVGGGCGGGGGGAGGGGGGGRGGGGGGGGAGGGGWRGGGGGEGGGGDRGRKPRRPRVRQRTGGKVAAQNRPGRRRSHRRARFTRPQSVGAALHMLGICREGNPPTSECSNAWPRRRPTRGSQTTRTTSMPTAARARWSRAIKITRTGSKAADPDHRPVRDHNDEARNSRRYREPTGEDVFLPAVCRAHRKSPVDISAAFALG